MSLMVVDMTTFAATVNVYVFDEAGTKVEKVKASPEEISQFMALEANTHKEIDKIVLVGSETYTSNIKNRASSLLESQYG